MMAASALALCCNTRALTPADVAIALRLLSANERARHDELGFPEDRRDYVAAHALLRSVLGSWLDTAPDQLRLGTTTLGKPFLSPSRRDLPTPSFSLAHSRDFVACVVGPGAPLGVDVEPVTRSVRAMEVARLVFSGGESSMLERCTEDERASLFCEVWTLREAFAKGCGVGLTSPMRLPAIEIVAGCLRVGCPPHWSFALADLQGTHKLAVASFGGTRVLVAEADAFAVATGVLEARADPPPVRSWSGDSGVPHAPCHNPRRPP
jgi:phosphopantetheinyl transferase